MSFREKINEAYRILNEATMTQKQRQKVSDMNRKGWDFKKKDKDKVVMTKGKDEVFVYPSGETFFPDTK